MPITAVSDPYLEPRIEGNAPWLIRLRWVAAIGQLATIAVATLVFRVRLPLIPLIAVVAITALTNLLFAWGIRGRLRTAAPRRNSHRLLALLMGLDLFSLGTLLYFTGGAENPFIVFYFVNLALAAVILPPLASWTLTAISIASVFVLLVVHHPLPDLRAPLAPPGIDMPTTLAQWGLWIAHSACAIVVVYFITRVTRELQDREAALRLAESTRSRSDKLEALGTLAAGAGHELATPLSTIAVVANELSKHLQGSSVPQAVLDDVRLIRDEVRNCRGILVRMTAHAAHGPLDPPQAITVGELLGEVLREMPQAPRVERVIGAPVANTRIVVPVQSVAQAIRGVVQNALDAASGPCQLAATLDPPQVVVQVRDQGPGMPRDVLARAGEPFFTTKEPGNGMGLGLFLTRSVVERIGGTLRLTSEAGHGVTAEIRIPIERPASERTS